MPDVRSATPADLPAIGRTLARAFEDDPVWQHLSKPGPRWLERGAAWFAAEARAQLAGHGEVLVDEECRGAAMWAPPNHWKATVAETLRIAPASANLFRSRIIRTLRVQSMMQKKHPADTPHWYLYILGTDPTHGGKGIGSALIEAVTERCDAEGLPAYLESSKERNVPFYGRHGFAVVEEVPLPDGPPIWRMWREPRG